MSGNMLLKDIFIGITKLKHRPRCELRIVILDTAAPWNYLMATITSQDHPKISTCGNKIIRILCACTLHVG